MASTLFFVFHILCSIYKNLSSQQTVLVCIRIRSKARKRFRYRTFAPAIVIDHLFFKMTLLKPDLSENGIRPKSYNVSASPLFSSNQKSRSHGQQMWYDSYVSPTEILCLDLLTTRSFAILINGYIYISHSPVMGFVSVQLFFLNSFEKLIQIVTNTSYIRSQSFKN